MRISDWSSDVCSSDLDIWDDPHRFDITREPSTSPQMTFGTGIHFCLGASLARAELQEALPLLASRMPGLTLDGPIEWKPPTVGIWGPSRLPLRFTPATTGSSPARSEEHTSELQSLMRNSYAVFCLKKKRKKTTIEKD